MRATSSSFSSARGHFRLRWRPWPFDCPRAPRQAVCKDSGSPHAVFLRHTPLAGISFSYKKRAACRENSRKALQAGTWFRRMNGYEMSYCKYLEPEASSVLSLHVFSQFFHTFLALCAAFGLSPDGAHAKTIQTSEKHAQNRGKTPKIEPLGAPPGDRTLEELRAKARPSASRATRYALSICLFGKVLKCWCGRF
jgi:hypothetical protein